MKAIKKILIVLVAFISLDLIVAVCLYTSFFGPSITIDYSKDSYIYVYGGDFVDPHSSCIYYDKIINYEIKDTIYNNTVRSAERTFNNYEIGIFENDVYGKYYSYVSRASKKSVVITDNENNKYVIGSRNTEDTLTLITNIINNTNLNVSYN